MVVIVRGGACNENREREQRCGLNERISQHRQEKDDIGADWRTVGGSISTAKSGELRRGAAGELTEGGGHHHKLNA